MKKLLLILLAFFAVFTYIRAFEETKDSAASPVISAEVKISGDFTQQPEIPVEIAR